MRTNDLFRDYLDGQIPMPAKPKPPTLEEAFQNFADSVGASFRNIFNAFQPIIKGLQDIGVIESPPPTDQRERALWAAMNRGTGPTPEPLRNRGRVNRYKEKP